MNLEIRKEKLDNMIESFVDVTLQIVVKSYNVASIVEIFEHIRDHWALLKKISFYNNNNNNNNNRPTTNFPNIAFPNQSQPNLPMPNDPEYVRRFQQLMQRYMTSPQFVASRQQMTQSYYPTSLFGSPNSFYTNMQPSLSTSQTSPTSPTSQTPQSEPPETRFRVQLRTLEEMGFVDQAANIRALLASGGDVNSAIEIFGDGDGDGDDGGGEE
ncbi:hypothetical protein Glove_508g14 [Diversispora epigaea]|uniref:UBA domain-containing protein n=1 Tax=Diversispora epigaea TaxID=1348612 RepID=A0A397GIK7_9GLOM|nr:hypothetical protein Glove_508g14 [Diversispora epigaea]